MSCVEPYFSTETNLKRVMCQIQNRNPYFQTEGKIEKKKVF